MIGKPVLTYAGSPERAHLEILGDTAVPYQNAQELCEFLRHPADARGLRTESGGRMEKFKPYQPEAVMRKFDQVFLK